MILTGVTTMTHHLSSINPNASLIVDASVIINLIASGIPKEIFASFPNLACVVDDIILDELDRGNKNGHTDASALRALILDKTVKPVSMTDNCWAHFEDLVSGNAATTLDDGEAATLAYCATHQSIPVIDEKKANRICKEKYPKLFPLCSSELFMLAQRSGKIKDAQLAEAVYLALSKSRMRVMNDHAQWVVNLVGPQRAANCTSLPRSTRQKLANAS